MQEEPKETPATEPGETETITESRPTSGRSPAPTLLILGFVIIMLLGVVIFQNLIPRGGSSSTTSSPAMESIKADIETRRADLNRARLSLGMEPIGGTDALESPDEVANRLKSDADTLAALAGSFQEMLGRKDAEIDQVRTESVAALKEQQRLREMLDTTNRDLRKALVDASLATTMQSDLERANARIKALQEELAAARDTPDEIRQELENALRENSELRKRLSELEERLRSATLFAGTESQIMEGAIELFRSLRRLEGKSDSEISTAYSQFGAKLGANVVKTCTFATGSSEISPELQEDLATIPDEATEGAMIFVVGYASETGNVDKNRTLSSDRATAVAHLLDADKAPGQKVQAAYLGQTDRFSSRIPERNQIVEIWQITPKNSR